MTTPGRNLDLVIFLTINDASRSNEQVSDAVHDLLMEHQDALGVTVVATSGPI